VYFATNRKVAGSNPAGVIGIFHRHNPSNRTMVLGSMQPLTEMSTRNISWGKGGRCLRLTTLPPSFAVVKSGNVNFLETSGSLQACKGTVLPLPLPLVFQDMQREFSNYCSLTNITGTLNEDLCTFLLISL